MVYTSYFAKAAKLKGIKLSISVVTPKWVLVDGHWNAVKPAWSLVEKYKSDADEKAYTLAYKTQLAGLDLAEDIRELLAIQGDVFLLCYEAPDKFCHRHLLAKYLNKKYGLEVQEYKEA